MVQETIRNRFRQSTVLTIAHRLETIRNSDRILVTIFLEKTKKNSSYLKISIQQVLEHGKVLEFDTPSALLANPRSHFTKLINELENTTPSS